MSESEILALLEYPINFKIMAGTYVILSLARVKLLQKTASQTGIKRIRGGTIKWGRVFDENKNLPNGAGNFMPCVFLDLSKQLLRKLGAPYADNTARLTNELQSVGILNLKRKAWADRGKARQFWVNFAFDPLGEPLHEEFDTSLWIAVGYDGIKRQFGRYQADRIQMKMEQSNRRDSNAKRHEDVV